MSGNNAWRLLLASGALLACSSGAPAVQRSAPASQGVAAAPPARSIAPPPLDRFPLTPMEYSRHERRAGADVQHTRYVEPCEADYPVILCTSVELDDRDIAETSHLRVDARGLVLEYADYADGIRISRTPPSITLPPDPKPGLCWSDDGEIRGTQPGFPDWVHREKAMNVIAASSQCSGGIEVTRSSERDDGARRTSKRVYCPGRGVVSGSRDNFPVHGSESHETWVQLDQL